MNRSKTYWDNIEIEHFITLVKESKSFAEVIRRANRATTGLAYRILKNKIIEFNISTEHFDSYRSSKNKS